MAPLLPDRPPRPRLALPGAIAAGADDLSVFFEGLANPTRLAVVELLAAGELRVSELAERCRVSQPRMSWHLRILRQARVVTTRREGREVFCSLDHAAIAAALTTFNRITDPGQARVPGHQPMVQPIKRGNPA